jgi:Calcineurin-like phosphoesterase
MPQPKAGKSAHSYDLFRKLLQSTGNESNASMSASGLAAAHDAAKSVVDDPGKRHQLIAELVQGVHELAMGAEKFDDNVMASPQNRIASILQSVLEEKSKQTRPGQMDLEMPFDKEDVTSVLKEVLSRTSRPDHPPKRPSKREDGSYCPPEKLDDSARIFVAGDFGTGMYGSIVTATTISKSPEAFSLLLHLGDIYYSGEPNEVKTRFLDIWPFKSGKRSRTLNGNHDMYSGGYGYFDVALPTFDQPSSYFAMQNASWTLLFLDTAYKDNDLDDQQVDWISHTIEASGNRKKILFSHHPLFSNFKNQGVHLAAKLHPFLQSRDITAWYWAHEHHCVIYDPHPLYGFKARCLGNGGMPSKRKKVADLPVEREIQDCMWRRMDGDLTPSCLILDGPNPYITEKPNKYLPHGYASLKIDGDRLCETIHLPNGDVLFSNEIV